MSKNIKNIDTSPLHVYRIDTLLTHVEITNKFKHDVYQPLI